MLATKHSTFTFCNIQPYANYKSKYHRCGLSARTVHRDKQRGRIPKILQNICPCKGRKRSAIVVNNIRIDAVAVKQISDEDATLIEFSYKGLNFYGASLYFAIDRDVGRDIGKVEEIRKLTRGKGLILSIDSNSRRRLWHGTQTNQRGKHLEEFIITSDLILMNEETDIPTFENIRGRSWIDLTLCNNTLAQKTRRWNCRGNESCSADSLYKTDYFLSLKG